MTKNEAAYYIILRGLMAEQDDYIQQKNIEKCQKLDLELFECALELIYFKRMIAGGDTIATITSLDQDIDVIKGRNTPFVSFTDRNIVGLKDIFEKVLKTMIEFEQQEK